MRSPWENKRGHALGATSKRDARRPAGGAPAAVPDAKAKLLGLPWSVKRKGRGGLGLCLLLFLGSACAGQSPRPETAPGARALIQELAGLRISVEAEAWNGRPKSLPDHVLPFLVRITNGAARPVTLSRTDFFLLDEANRQYLPLPPIEVVSLLGGRAPSGVAVSPSIGISGSTAGDTIFGGGLGILFGGYGTDTRDVIPGALAEGPVQPGAEARGFLYFPPPASGPTALRLVVIIRDLPGEPRLDFEFPRTPG